MAREGPRGAPRSQRLPIGLALESQHQLARADLLQHQLVAQPRAFVQHLAVDDDEAAARVVGVDRAAQRQAGPEARCSQP